MKEQLQQLDGDFTFSAFNEPTERREPSVANGTDNGLYLGDLFRIQKPASPIKKQSLHK